MNADKMMISLPQLLSAELNEFSKELHIPKSRIIQQALDYYFDTLDLQIAKNRVAKGNKRVNLEQMKAFVDAL